MRRVKETGKGGEGFKMWLVFSVRRNSVIVDEEPSNEIRKGLF